MEAHVQIKLFASLKRFLPDSADRYAIEPGITVGELLDRLKIPREEATLIFLNGVKSAQATPLMGGERIGMFPPVGGG